MVQHARKRTHPYIAPGSDVVDHQGEDDRASFFLFTAIVIATLLGFAWFAMRTYG